MFLQPLIRSSMWISFSWEGSSVIYQENLLRTISGGILETPLLYLHTISLDDFINSHGSNS